MTKNTVAYAIAQFERALTRLLEAIHEAADGNVLKQDGAIQRFEFTFELLWKMLKVYLEFQGVQARNPRDVLKAAFRQQLLDDETTYLTMLDDRNLCSHVYDEKTVRQVFGRIQQRYCDCLTALLTGMKARAQ